MVDGGPAEFYSYYPRADAWADHYLTVINFNQEVIQTKCVKAYDVMWYTYRFCRVQLS